MITASYRHKFNAGERVDFERAGVLHEGGIIYQVVHVQAEKFNGVKYVISHGGQVHHVSEDRILRVGEREPMIVTYEHDYYFGEAVNFERAGLEYERAQVVQVLHVQSKYGMGTEYTLKHKSHIHRIAQGSILKEEAL